MFSDGVSFDGVLNDAGGVFNDVNGASSLLMTTSSCVLLHLPLVPAALVQVTSMVLPKFISNFTVLLAEFPRNALV